LTVCRLEDYEVGDASDLNAQVAALGSFRRDEEQGLAGTIGGISGVDHLLRAGNKTQRNADALNRLGWVSVGVYYDHRQFALNRALWGSRPSRGGAET
jgi:hypothetical protein